MVESEARAREITTYRQERDRRAKTDQEPISLENIFENLAANKAEEFMVVIKADVQGSLEAIVSALEKIGNEEIKCRILHAAVGAISETDISLAQASGAPIIGFNVRANSQARALAEQDNVTINYYTVIYDLVDEVKAAMSGKLKPLFEEIIIGLAEVKDIFSAGKGRASRTRSHVDATGEHLRNSRHPSRFSRTQAKQGRVALASSAYATAQPCPC